MRMPSRLATLVVITTAGMLVGPAVATAVIAEPAPPVDAPSSLVENYTYPGATNIEVNEGIKLIKGDGRIVKADCDGNPDLIKVETLIKDVCFSVKGDTGWLTMQIEAVFLVGAGDQNLAVKVDGMATPINVPEGTSRSVQAADPTRRGLVVELRASAKG
ncbi:MAG TPA: hypothetical protein VK453_15325 [Micromonosporaceae bacterium]|nr:hypothetical protein [Micromonosporaceae bacterium]